VNASAQYWQPEMQRHSTSAQLHQATLDFIGLHCIKLRVMIRNAMHQIDGSFATVHMVGMLRLLIWCAGIGVTMSDALTCGPVPSDAIHGVYATIQRRPMPSSAVWRAPIRLLVIPHKTGGDASKFKQKVQGPLTKKSREIAQCNFDHSKWMRG
jgi:hypothetical protein